MISSMGYAKNSFGHIPPNRESLAKGFEDHQIGTSPYWLPIHHTARHTAARFGLARHSLPMQWPAQRAYPWPGRALVTAEAHRPRAGPLLATPLKVQGHKLPLPDLAGRAYP